MIILNSNWGSGDLERSSTLSKGTQLRSDEGRMKPGLGWLQKSLFQWALPPGIHSCSHIISFLRVWAALTDSFLLNGMWQMWWNVAAKIVSKRLCLPPWMLSFLCCREVSTMLWWNLWRSLHEDSNSANIHMSELESRFSSSRCLRWLQPDGRPWRTQLRHTWILDP